MDTLALTVGRILIVTKKMPCRRETSGRRATIPDGQQIIILSVAPVSGHVHFLVANPGQQETFTSFQTTIERYCAGAKPAALKAE